MFGLNFMQNEAMNLAFNVAIMEDTFNEQKEDEMFWNEEDEDSED